MCTSHWFQGYKTLCLAHVCPMFDQGGERVPLDLTLGYVYEDISLSLCVACPHLLTVESPHLMTRPYVHVHLFPVFHAFRSV